MNKNDSVGTWNSRKRYRRFYYASRGWSKRTPVAQSAVSEPGPKRARFPAQSKQGRWSPVPAYDMVYSIDPNTLGIQKGQFMGIKGMQSRISVHVVREPVLTEAHVASCRKN